jgi:hypothetical protein
MHLLYALKQARQAQALCTPYIFILHKNRHPASRNRDYQSANYSNPLYDKHMAAPEPPKKDL